MGTSETPGTLKHSRVPAYRPTVCVAKCSVPLAMVLPSGKCQEGQEERKGCQALGEREESLQVELGVESQGRGGRRGSGKGAGSSQKPPQALLHFYRKPAVKSVTEISTSGNLVDWILYTFYMYIP